MNKSSSASGQIEYGRSVPIQKQLARSNQISVPAENLTPKLNNRACLFHCLKLNISRIHSTSFQDINNINNNIFREK